jgi:hypothetical protein
MTIHFTDKPGARRCGGCTLCCKLLPRKEIHKPANTRCEHQRTGKGCAIYARRPGSCALSCRWLLNDDCDDLSRPDRSHYVIDIMPDFITITPPDMEPVQIPVLQIWCDPKFPNAHRDPALRAYVQRHGEKDGFAALIRYSSDEAFLLVPPAVNPKGTWFEYESQLCTANHTALDVLNVLGGGERVVPGKSVALSYEPREEIDARRRREVPAGPRIAPSDPAARAGSG